MTADENYAARLERGRWGLSWICVSVFTLSFVTLLGLSATTYWTPDNGWIPILDRALKISGVVGIVLWQIPYVSRAFRRLRDFKATE
jgi:hypothetical protein